jgi:hypothetical protein
VEQKQYKVIFSGGAIPSHDVERVKNNLAALFRVESSRLDPLFKDRLVVLKKNLSLTDADSYRESVEAVGGYCIIEAMGESPERSVLNMAEKVEKMACPKCHVVQPKMPICRACGTVVQEFRERLDLRRSEVMASLEQQTAASGVPVNDRLPDQADTANPPRPNK